MQSEVVIYSIINGVGLGLHKQPAHNLQWVLKQIRKRAPQIENLILIEIYNNSEMHVQSTHLTRQQAIMHLNRYLNGPIHPSPRPSKPLRLFYTATGMPKSA